MFLTKCLFYWQIVYMFVPYLLIKLKTMTILDTFDNEVTKETLKDFVMINGNFTISTEEDIVDIHFLRQEFFVVKNGKVISIRKTFNQIWHWIKNTNMQWQLEDDLN